MPAQSMRALSQLARLFGLEPQPLAPLQLGSRAALLAASPRAITTHWQLRLNFRSLLKRVAERSCNFFQLDLQLLAEAVGLVLLFLGLLG